MKKSEMRRIRRSDAILAIEQCLIESHFPNDSTKEAEIILKKLEKLGMLPPVKKNCPVTLRSEYVWDPENE